MKILFILYLFFMVGCIDLKNAKPILNVYGESDYYYVKAGIMWGSDISTLEKERQEEEFLRGESNSGSSKGGSSGGGGGCSGGSCSEK